MAVNFDKRKQRWRAELYYKKARVHIGYFKTQEEANKVFTEGMAEIEKGNIPEILLLKLEALKAGPPDVQKYVMSQEEIEALAKPPKTTIVLYPNGDKPFVIESYPARVMVDRYFAKQTEYSARSKCVSFVSLPRVRWLESEGLAGT